MALTACSLATGTPSDPIWKGKPAKQYPFVLDPFQRVAIACLVSQVWCSALGSASRGLAIFVEKSL